MQNVFNLLPIDCYYTIIDNLDPKSLFNYSITNKNTYLESYIEYKKLMYLLQKLNVKDKHVITLHNYKISNITLPNNNNYIFTNYNNILQIHHIMNIDYNNILLIRNRNLYILTCQYICNYNNVLSMYNIIILYEIFVKLYYHIYHKKFTYYYYILNFKKISDDIHILNYCLRIH